MKRILAVALIAACALTAPGLPCYQALASMNAGKSGLPTPRTSIPGAAAVPIDLEFAAGTLAPQSDSVLSNAPPAHEASPLPALERPESTQEQSTDPSSGPSTAPAPERSSSPSKTAQAPAATSPKPGPALKAVRALARISPDQNLSSAKQGQDGTYDAVGSAQEQPVQVNGSLDGFSRVPRYTILITAQSIAQPRATSHSSAKIEQVPRPQFTLRGLLFKVFVPLALSIGLVRIGLMGKNLSSKEEKMWLVDSMIDSGYHAFTNESIDGRSLSQPWARQWAASQPWGFVSFIRSIDDLHEGIQGPWKNLPVPWVIALPEHTVANTMISAAGKPMSGEELKASYAEYLSGVQKSRLAGEYSDGPYSFEEFKILAEQYKFYWETRQRYLSGSLNPTSKGDAQRIYIDYIHEVIGPRAQSRGLDIDEMDRKAKGTFAALKTLGKDRQHFYMSIFVWITSLALYLMHGPLRRGWPKLWRKIRRQS